MGCTMQFNLDDNVDEHGEIAEAEQIVGGEGIAVEGGEECVYPLTVGKHLCYDK